MALILPDTFLLTSIVFPFSLSIMESVGGQAEQT